ncbi:MAG: hypothetical protein QOH25_1058, partial [Acidobacteriota bacterium]|nr:hypothetical protein [Acidobacteriota bacterium]
ITVESVRIVPGFNWLTQIVIKLSDNLLGAGDLWVHIKLHGETSNSAAFWVGDMLIEER